MGIFVALAAVYSYFVPGSNIKRITISWLTGRHRCLHLPG